MRGQNLENTIEKTNENYLSLNLAFIYKNPSAVLYTKKGVRKIKSIVDFSGQLFDKRGVYFDAKETENKSLFPFDNIEDHQLNFLHTMSNYAYFCGILIHFTKLDLAYLVPITVIYDMKQNNRSSIKLTELKDEWKVNLHDYLGIVDE